MTSPLFYLYSLLTIAVFTIGILLNKRLKSSILNPFILAFLLLVGVLLLGDIPFHDYYQGNAPLNQLLGVSVVALAVPFYEQLPQIRKQWKTILLIVLIATLFAMLSGIALGLLFGATKEIIAALLPKSVTTAIAVVITEELGGEPALASIGVIIAGLTGSVFGYVLLKRINVQRTEAIGLSIGAASHALGTARIMEHSIKAGSYSSVALVLCGILSSIIAPLVFKLVVWLVF